MDAAIQLTRRHLGPLAVISALFAIPSIAIGIVARSVMPATTVADPTAFGEMASATLILMVLAAANASVTGIGVGALVIAASGAYENGATPEPMRATRAALRRAWAIVAGNFMGAALVGLVVGALMTAAAMLMGVLLVAVQMVGPGLGGVAAQVTGMVMGIALFSGTVALALVFGVRYANITAAAVLEGLGPWRALRRSTQLVKGRLWPTAGVVGIGIVLYLVAYVTALAIAMLIFRDFELASTASGVATIVTYPFIGCLMTVLYYDLRIRREGYDVELLARALDATDATAGAGAGVDAGPPTTPGDDSMHAATGL